jgi:hypothetical protein
MKRYYMLVYIARKRETGVINNKEKRDRILLLFCGVTTKWALTANRLISVNLLTHCGTTSYMIT